MSDYRQRVADELERAWQDGEISHADACAERGGSMTTEPIYCPAQTYRQTRDNPAEWCENEVEDYGDLCPEHDEDDRADADYDNYLESLREK